jgi:hypothetical protein
VSPVLARLLAYIGLLGPERLLVPLRRNPLRADVVLHVDREDGSMAEVQFRVDSGCSHTVISMAEAITSGLPTTGPRRTLGLGAALSSATVEVVSRTWSFRLSPRQSSAPFVLPVYLLLNQPANLTPLLGLAGVIEQIRWTFDGRSATDAPFGFCLLEDQRPVVRRYPD